MEMQTQEATMITLEINGRVDALTAPDLRSRLTELIDDGAQRLLVDLSGVDFIDSAGLAALVKSMKSARSAGGDIELARPRSDSAYRVFELTKFDQVFTIHPARG